MDFIIKLNNSEELAFFGIFGLFFALPNFNNLFIEEIFPVIIRESTQFSALLKIIYFILLVALTYESIGWTIELAKNIDKTRYLNVNFDWYMLKVVIFGLLGIILAVVINRLLFPI